MLILVIVKLSICFNEIKNESAGIYLHNSPGRDVHYSLKKAAGHKRPTIQISPIRSDRNKWASSNKEKAR